ncbi:uncharacterized protein CBL_14301 [Carabus blaptoides fortunei]
MDSPENNIAGHTYDARPTVHISKGTIVGVKVYPDVSMVAVNAYLGIPYAEPPEGYFRFAVPQRHRGWNGTLYANNYKSVCPFRTKFGVKGNENCLYLNIWTPENAFSHKLPVLVYLESGQLLNENTDLIRIAGHDLATEGVVVVSITYRQNIFGYFCLGSPDARGNLGLLDQYMALIWIKENISKFGGNQEIVTLMGHSTSAVAVMYHLASPRTRRLFTNGIIMSGSVKSPSYPHNPIPMTKKLIQDLGCTMSSVQSSLECLRTKSVEEILSQFYRQTQVDNWYTSIMPVIDTFLSEDARYLPHSLDFAIQHNNLSSVPILTGITDTVPNIEQWTWNKYNLSFGELVEYAETSVVPNLLHQYEFDKTSNDAVKDIIHWKYIWSEQKDVQVLSKGIHDMQWDALVAAPHDRQLHLLVNSTRIPVYAYYLELNTFTNMSVETNVGADLLLLFGPVLLQQIARRRFNTVEARLSTLLKQFWISFIKRGNPNPTNGYADTWQPYTSSYKQIQHVANGKWDAIAYENAVTLWNKLLPKLGTAPRPVNTIPKELQYSPDPAAGFRHAMYTLVALVMALLTLLLVCVVLLKRRAKEKLRQTGF